MGKKVILKPNELEEMEIGERKKLYGDINVLRIPQGWIYMFISGASVGGIHTIFIEDKKCDGVVTNGKEKYIKLKRE